MLLQHLLLGFELGVYAPHEHCMLFWCARRAIARRPRQRAWARARLRPVSSRGVAAAAWAGARCDAGFTVRHAFSRMPGRHSVYLLHAER